MGRVILVLEEGAVTAIRGGGKKLPKIKKAMTASSDAAYAADAWKECVIELRKDIRFNSAVLVLPPSMCQAKVVRVPKLSGIMLDEMARREAEEAFKSGSVGWSAAARYKTDMLLCCAGADSRMLADIFGMFKNIGVKINAVTVPMEGHLRLIFSNEAYRRGTGVFLFFSDGGMTSILMDGGQYKHSMRTRILSEPGTDDFATEVVRAMSGMLQFSATGGSEASISNVYYLGCHDEDFEACREGLDAIGLTASRMALAKRSKLPDSEGRDWTACAGSLLKVEDGIMLRESRNVKDPRAVSRSMASLFVPPIIIAAVCLGAAYVVYYAADWHNNEAAKINAWLETDLINEKYEQAQTLYDENMMALNAKKAVTHLKDNMSTYPRVTAAVIKKIQDASGDDIAIVIHAYDSSSGLLSFDAESAEAIAIPAYVTRLESTGLFDSVSYTGYNLQEDGYVLGLSCVMKGNDVKKDDAKGGDAE